MWLFRLIKRLILIAIGLVIIFLGVDLWESDNHFWGGVVIFLGIGFIINYGFGQAKKEKEKKQQNKAQALTASYKRRLQGMTPAQIENRKQWLQTQIYLCSQRLSDTGTDLQFDSLNRTLDTGYSGFFNSVLQNTTTALNMVNIKEDVELLNQLQEEYHYICNL